MLFLDSFVTDQLQKIWKDLIANGKQSGNSTIYHFGFSEEEKSLVGFVYRSTNNFASERIKFGLSVKPPISVDSGSHTYSNSEEFDNFMIDLMRKQRKEDLEMPLENQVGIGGEIQKAVLLQNGISIKTIYKFLYTDVYRVDWFILGIPRRKCSGKMDNREY